MRLESIELIRFGAFEGHPVVDGFEPGLNVVCDQNEAGKSTLLGALRFGLFGGQVLDYRPDEADRSVRLGLWHAGRSWVLRRSDGRGRAAFDLRADDDSIVIRAPEFRQEWLHGLNSSTYQSVYALSLDDLQWQNDLRDLLILAETGVLGARLRITEREVDRAAGELFSPAGRRPALNAALERWQHAHQAVRALSHRPAELDSKCDELDQLDRAISSDQEQREVLLQRKARGDELLKALPQWKRLQVSRDHTARLAEVAEFPPTSLEEYRRAKADAAQARQTLEREEARGRAAAEALAPLEVDETILAQAEEIERLRETATGLAQWPAQLREAEDRARRERQAAFDEVAQRCGPTVAIGEVAALDASAVVRNELARFRDRLDGLRQALGLVRHDAELAAQAREEAAKRLRAAAAAVDELPAPVEEEMLSRKRQAADEAPARIGSQRAAKHAQEAAQHRLAELRAQRQREEEAQREAETSQRENEQRIKDAQAAASPRSRGASAILWVLAGTALAIGIAALLADQPVFGAADLVVGMVLIGVAAARSAVQVVWPTVSLRVPSLAGVTDEAIAAAQDAVERAAATQREATEQLERLAGSVGLPGAAGEEEWTRFRARVSTEIEDARRARAARDAAVNALKAAETAAAEAGERAELAERKLQGQQAELDEAQVGWKSWLSGLGLDPELAPEAALIWLETAQTVQQREQAAVEAEVVRDQRRDELTQLRTRAEAIAIALDQPLAPDDRWGLLAAQRWAGLLTAARENARRRQDITADLDSANEAAAAARDGLQQAEEAQAAALRRGGASNEDTLIRRSRQAEELVEVQQELRAAEAGLRAGREEADWTAFQQDLHAADEAALNSEQEDLGRELKELGDRLQTQRDQAAVLRQEIADLRREGALADALLGREQAVAEVAALVDEWAINRGAAALLRLTLQRHEAQRQPKQVHRIGDLFRDLTANRWDGVVARDGELLAVRQQPELQLPAAKLSRGARDALFLCARVAALEHKLDDGPLPVVLDDTLVNLDGQRRPRMLEMIGELAQRTQIIVFTCHDFVVRGLAELEIPYHEVKLPGVATAGRTR